MLKYTASLKKPNIIIRLHLLLKHPLLSHSLVFGPECILSVEMKNLTTVRSSC